MLEYTRSNLYSELQKYSYTFKIYSSVSYLYIRLKNNIFIRNSNNIPVRKHTHTHTNQ